MSNANYITAKTILNLLTDEQKRKLCREILEGIDKKNLIKKDRVKKYINWLDKK